MNLKKLQIQREANRRIIDRLIEKLEMARDEERLTDFKGILDSVEKKVSALESVNEKIIAQTDIDNLEEEMLQTDEHSLNVELKLRHFRLFRDQRSNRIQITPSELHSSGKEVPTANHSIHIQPLSINPSASISSNASQFSRLPKLSLPTFDGDLLQWQSFWDSFESPIHLNVNLTDVQKFSYLKSQLEGQAAMTVTGFALTNANYTRTVELLKDRYGQQHRIVHATMQALLNLPSPTSTLTSLRQFHDRMETYIRGLEAMGQCQDSYGSLLVPIILDKLPTDIRKNLARENGSSYWQLVDLRRAINKEINILEAGNSNTRPSIEAYQPTAIFYTEANTRKQREFNTHAARSQSKPTLKCAFCQENHFSNECRKYRDMDTRMTVVKQNQLCFNCLGRHKILRCNSQKTCRFCNKRHHSSICYQNPKFHVTSSHNSDTTILHTREERPDVLLKTAVGKVGYNGYVTSAHILFDEGAQRTFITEKLANKLNLRRTGIDTLRLASFGDRTHHVRHLDTAEIFIHTGNGEKLKLQVVIVPTIALPFQNKVQQIATKLPYLQGLKLAHPENTDDRFEISLLIGADYYWHVVQDKVIRGSGPTAVQSKLGYLLSGPIHQPNNSSYVDYVMNVATFPQDIDKLRKLESLEIAANKGEDETTNVIKTYYRTQFEYKSGKYKTKLPWKPIHKRLPKVLRTTRRQTENNFRERSKRKYCTAHRERTRTVSGRNMQDYAMGDLVQIGDLKPRAPYNPTVVEEQFGNDPNRKWRYK